MNYEKIFVAGSSGMVGSAICRKLEKSGYGKSAHNGKLLRPNRNELDLFDSEKVNLWFKANKPEIVVLAAAKVGGIYANSSNKVNFLLENLKIQNNVIESAFRNNVKRFLFLGSSCIYPKEALQPIKEEFLLSNSLEKTNEPYAIAKIAGLKLCEYLKEEKDFDAISLMPSNLYGTGDNYHKTNSHVMAALIRKFYEAKKNNQNEVICWGSGKPLREFMHVDDLADASIFVLENWHPNSSQSPKNLNGNPDLFINVGVGKDISIYDLAKKIAKIIDYQGKIVWDKTQPDGTFRKLLDCSKLNKLGWFPKIDLESGIHQSLNEFANLRI